MGRRISAAAAAAPAATPAAMGPLADRPRKIVGQPFRSHSFCFMTAS